MSFLRWLDGLNAGIDKALAAKRAVNTVLNAAHAHSSVTEPIRQALEFVKGFKKDEKTEGGEDPEAAETNRQE